MAVEEGKRL